MKKVWISGAVAIIFAAYVFYQHEQSNKTKNTQIAVMTNLPASGSGGSFGSNNPTSQTPSGTTTNTQSHGSPVSGQYKDGVYTGNAVNAFYGNIQVQAVISAGKLTDVKFLQYPNDRSRSAQVSSLMMPILRQEAITTQSSNVDTVSGATQDSEAFTASLQSALDQAKS